ncbi:hypothetical protein JTB14_009194 [Gonioctena quinquepunctata]|nr:hypothetical protein JTB14_009194 [Gonioctena quinquepunctata]
MRRREKNILIFGIPENEPNLDNFIQDAFSSVDPMMVMDSLHFSRIGRLPPNDPNKCRPVKVELPGTTHVLSLLKRNKKLQANRKYQDIFFVQIRLLNNASIFENSSRTQRESATAKQI